MTTTPATMWEHGMTSAQIASSSTAVPDRVIVVNTDTGEIRVGDGVSVPSALPVIGPQTAAQVPFSAGGGIGATDVQAAILEARSDAIAASAPAGSAVTTVNGEGPGAVTLSAADVSASRSRPWQFYVEDFGAVGD